MSNLTILISGCGITFDTKSHKTWTRVFKSLGYNVVDVSGPAVSNQWILNKSVLKLMSTTGIDKVVLQLTSLNKLDIEVDKKRIEQLVIPDNLRNFVVQPDLSVQHVSMENLNQITTPSVWPSSASSDHPAKKLWKEFLSSPGLELEDIFCKLLLLDLYCKTNNIELLVFQGYRLPWSSHQTARLGSIIKNLDRSFYDDYRASHCYQKHDFTDNNTVPCFEYQVLIADTVGRHLHMASATREKMSNIKSKYVNES